MYTFTSIEFDPSGVLEINPDLGSDISNMTRRVGSIATLDGGRAFEDRGFTDADRELNLAEPGATKATLDRASYFIRLYAVVRMYAPDGVYLVTIQQVNYQSGALVMRVLIRSKEA